jgi:hypothetical protein
MFKQAKWTINYFRYPGFIPGLNCSTRYRISYCPKRLGAIELMKQLGRFPVDEFTYNNNRVPIRPIDPTVDVFDVAYKDVVIDNTPFKNDVCAKCQTPLYDNVYLTYITHDSPTAKAYCPTCMHTEFLENGEMFLGNQNPHHPTPTTRLYNNHRVLAKTTYPTTYNQVIDLVENETVKEVLRGMYSKKSTVVRHHTNPALLWLDFNHTQQEYQDKIYVGFDDLNKYFDFCYNSQEYSPTKSLLLGVNEDNVFKHTVLFPISFIRE